MKDIKTFLIGFLTCCCLFLIMGQTVVKRDKAATIYSLEESDERLRKAEERNMKPKELGQSEKNVMEDIKSKNISFNLSLTYAIPK